MPPVEAAEPDAEGEAAARDALDAEAERAAEPVGSAPAVVSAADADVRVAPAVMVTGTAARRVDKSWPLTVVVSVEV